MRINAGRFPSTRMFARRGHRWQSWRPGQRTPMQENTTTMTHTSNHVLSRTEIHKHTKHKPLSCERCPQPGAVATTSWRLKTITNSKHASSHSNAAIANTHGQQRWSCPSLHNSRVSRENVADHGGWTNHSNAIPNSTMTEINECTHHNGTTQTSTAKTEGLGIRTSLCTHPTLWRPHRDHPDPKPTWWHSSSRSNAGMPTIHAKTAFIVSRPRYTRIAWTCSQSWERSTNTLQCCASL